MGNDGNEGSRDANTYLQRVGEHMEVVASDGEKIGTVDKVRGDRIILTRNDPKPVATIIRSRRTGSRRSMTRS